MKINELTQQKVTKANSQEVELTDPMTGVKTTYDLKKNPSAVSKDPITGEVEVNTIPNKTLNGQNKKPSDKKTVIKPGDKVKLK